MRRSLGIAFTSVALWFLCANAVHAREPASSLTAVPGRPPAPDLLLQPAEGANLRLSDLRGKVVVVNFWATWCPPCKAEIPWFVEFAEKYRDQRLAVIGISVDDPAEDIRQFAEEYKINYPMLVGLGHDDLRQAYDAAAVIPVSWLIKPDGTVFAKAAGIHSKDWFEDKIKALF